MPGGQLTSVLAHLRRIMGGVELPPRSDAELLGHFLDRQDADAFTQLVRRHGRLVWNVCVRQLHQEQDAEDAFQATFLILARKARSIRKQPSLASWLHGVAYRTAGRIRQRRQQERERAMQHANPPYPPFVRGGGNGAFASGGGNGAPDDNASWHELRPILDEEVNQLPEKYRTPVVLCYFEGKTNDEAARALGWPKGTVAGRLARARDLLRARLSRRGLAFSSACLASVITANAATAAVPELFLSTIPPAALAFAAGNAAATTSAAALAEGVMHAMFITKLRVAVAACLGLTLLVLGGGTAAYRAFGGDDTAATNAKGGGIAITASAVADEKPKTDEELLYGTWVRVKGGDDPALKDKPVRSFDKIIFTKDRFQFCFGDLKHDYGWKINATKSPKELDIIEVEPTPGKAKQKPMPCIYKLDGDTLEVAMGDPGFRPNDFAKAAKFGQHYVLKRERAVEKPKSDQDLLLGSWTVVSKGDKPGIGDKVTFTPERVLLHFGPNVTFRCKYALDPSKTPKTMDIHGAENGTGLNPATPYQCIYQLDGDDLQLAIGSPSGRPKSFAEATKDGQQVVLKREKPAAEKPKTDEELIQGTWKWEIRSEATGKLQSEETLIFKGDRYWRVMGDGRELGPYRFRLDPTKTPKTIDSHGLPVFPPEKGQPNDRTEESIYELDGDSLKIGRPVPMRGGGIQGGADFGSRPTDFKAASVRAYRREKPSEGRTSGLRVIPLKHIDAAQIAKVLDGLVNKDAKRVRIIADTQTNSLLVQNGEQLDEVLRLVALFEGEAEKRSASPKGPEPSFTPRGREIVKEMIETAKQEWQLRNEEYRAGRIGADSLERASRRLVEAHGLDPARRADFLKALEEHVQRAKAIEATASERYKAGAIPAAEVTVTKYHRLEAELWLEQEKAKKEKE
jgi:RNA polymerase sigma factor (sigma-70 family)